MTIRHFAMAAALAALLNFGAFPLQASGPLNTIVAAYLKIQAQLAADSIESIKGPVQTIVDGAAGMGEGGSGIAAAAKELGSAPDLKTAREKFGPLSDAVIAAAKAAGWKDLGDLQLAYCPMADRSWLQEGTKISNPYYGSAMLTCGEIKPR